MRDEPGTATPVSWGRHPFEVGVPQRLRLGPLSLWACRYAREWCLWIERRPDPFEPTLQPLSPCSHDDIPPDAEALRFGFLEPPSAIRLLPALADRPIVVRPEDAFSVAPGESVDLFVSFPVWLRVGWGDEGTTHHALPVFRPSDIWFGPSTREGELCYASRSVLQLDPGQLLLRPHRVVTELRLHNRGDDVLWLERLKVPVQHLSIFVDAAGGLWTDTLTLVRQPQSSLVSVRLGGSPSAHAGTTRRLTEPQARADGNLVERAIQALLQR